MSVHAVSSSTSPLPPSPPPPPPNGLPTDRRPTADEVQANHGAFQQSLVGVYQTGVQNTPTIPGNGNGSGTGQAPPTQVLGDNPNDAFKAGLVDNFISQSQNAGNFGGPQTPPPFGSSSSTPPFGAAPQQQLFGPLSASGIGVNFSSSS